MIFQALYDLAVREHLLDKPAYEPVRLSYLIKLGAGGSYRGYSAPREQKPRKGNGKPEAVAPVRWVPRRSESRTGTKLPSDFLVDNASFVFGRDPAGKFSPDVLRARRGRFIDYIAAAERDLRLPGLAAVLSFLQQDTPAELDTLLSPEDPGEQERRGGELFAFVYEPLDVTACVHEHPDVYEWFAARLAAENYAGRGQCLVTGDPDAVLVRLHGKPKNIPPVSKTKGGVTLTSVNREAFKSYGMEGVQCAPVSQRASLAIETALNRLLNSSYARCDGTTCEPRNVQLSPDTVLLFWSREEARLDWFGIIESESPERVADLLRGPFDTGHAPIHDPSHFYALILSGALGRAIVRSFLRSTVAAVANAIDRYREEVRILRPYGQGEGSYALRDYRTALVPRGDLKLLPPALATDLYLAIVFDRPFPYSILQTIVRRNRVEFLPKRERGDARDDAMLAMRCSLLKAWLNRNRKENVSVALDRQRPDPPYRLGRLLAAIDRLQQDALGNVNATLVDRYYGSASSTPEAVFPTLLRRSQHHLGKLRREKPGLAVNTEKLLQEIVGDLPRFPKTMTLEQQGLFALGFYHQRQDFFTKKEENANG